MLQNMFERNSNTTKIETAQTIYIDIIGSEFERNSNTTKIETIDRRGLGCRVDRSKEILIQQRLKPHEVAGDAARHYVRKKF